MKRASIFLVVVAFALGAGNAEAGITYSATSNGFSVPGVVQNTFWVNTDSDFLSAVLFVTLHTGTVYDPFNASLTLDGDSLGVSNGDTFFTANGNSLTGIAGGAGDLGHVHPTTPGAAEVGPTVLGVSWFSPGSDTDDIGAGLPIGRFSFSDDANGVAQLLLINAADEQLLLSGGVTGGMLFPEPASLGLLGLGGLALLRSRG